MDKFIHLFFVTTNLLSESSREELPEKNAHPFAPSRFPSLDMPRVVEGFHVSKSHAGARIYHQSWHPDPSVEGDPRGATAPLAAVVWAHGVHEHSGRFARVFEHLARAGVASHAWDHVGHGRSDACPTGIPHQFANGLDAVVEDAAQYFR